MTLLYHFVVITIGLYFRPDGFGLLSTMTSDLSESTYMTGLGTSNLGFSTGLFDFGPTAGNQCNNVKDVEICRLREELGAARAKLHSWEESMGQARTACDAWKKEAALANKKAELANKEKEVAVAKANSLQKEVSVQLCFDWLSYENIPDGAAIWGATS